MKKTAAFTLIELLILIVLISIVVAMSTPRFSSMYKSMKSRTEAKKAFDFVKHVSALSVRRRTALSLIRPDERTLAIKDFSGRNASLQASGETALELQPEEITFYPNSAITPFSLMIRTEGGFEYEVSVSEKTTEVIFTDLTQRSSW